MTDFPDNPFKSGEFPEGANPFSDEGLQAPEWEDSSCSLNPFSDEGADSGFPGGDPFERLPFFSGFQEMPTENDPLLTPLNDAQRAAVLHAEGPLLVLAGAGSGKTRVITHRIAYLTLRRRVFPWHILAVTFTNKAAGEMRSRLHQLMGPSASSCQVSTFHALAASLLRREAEKVGLTKSFVIYDDSDTMQLIRRVLKDMDLTDEIKSQRVRQKIDQAKNEGKRPEDLSRSSFERADRFIPEIYQRYEEQLRKANAVDFGGLILELTSLFKRDGEVLARYRDRFRYVMVDEFQDTNPIQYELIRLLCPQGNDNLCAVGDDDQSIYRWRGADPANILSFESHFPGTRVVKLEQNYRSDGAILDAAYAVISKNRHRAQKRLWTQRGQGLPFHLIPAQDERDEARQIAAAISRLAKSGVSFSDIAVFYRVNAQSRVLEEALRLSAIPYRVVHGRAFYDREEIKDAGAYLRLAINPRSDADFVRVINKPARGIGGTTLTRLQDFSRKQNISLFESLERMDEIDALGAAARKRLAGFLDILRALSVEVAMAKDARGAVERMLEISGLVQALQTENTDEAGERIENLSEFAGAAGEFDRLRAEVESARQALGSDNWNGEDIWLSLNLTPLESFLEQVSLLGDADDSVGSGKVSLMTLHAAKGLEFNTVFMTGMEEGIFPHIRAFEWGGSQSDDNEELAEERRLCYVGITRAMKRLIFSLARTRTIFGNFQINEPSRFLRDIPPDLFDFQEPARGHRQQDSAGTHFQAPRLAPVGPQIRRYVPDQEKNIGRSSSTETYYDADEDTGISPYGRASSSGRSASSAASRERKLELDPDFCPTDVDFDQRSDYERRSSLKVGKGPLPVPGDKVSHGSFGTGTVVSSGGQPGPNAILTVHFPGLGEKRILARFLKKI